MKQIGAGVPGYLTTAEVAQALGVDDRSVRRYVNAGAFPHAVAQGWPGGRRFLIPEADVEALKAAKTAADAG